MILTIRTDKPEAELGLFLENGTKVAYRTWHAHRELSSTIHKVIKEILDSANMGWADLIGVIFYKGPGSFTGLRIGASVANAISDVNNVRLCANSGDHWIENGIKNLQKGNNEPAVPDYGSPANTTKPKK